MQFYTDSRREDDPHALPNAEVFYIEKNQVNELETGWYWWSCFPGCHPDSDPFGPFKTQEEAIADAQDDWQG
jgi:hypothetical protein